MTYQTWLAPLVILAVVLMVPTAAVALDSQDSDTGVQFDPESEYATIENGELRLDFDRLNKDATTTVDAVFEVTATNDTVRQFWVSHDLEGVRFYTDGNRQKELDAGNPQSLTNGETTTVGVSIDTHDAPTGTHTFSIVVESEEDDDDDDGVSIDLGPFEVTNATVEPTNVETGDPLTVTATVTNPGNWTASGTIPLTVDNTVVDDRYLKLAPDENRTISFTWTPEDPGVHDVSVGGQPAGTVAVSDPGGPRLGSQNLASPLTAAVAPPATLGLLFLGSVARGRRR